VAGWLASLVNLSTMFLGAGLGLSLTALGAWLFTPMARLSDTGARDRASPAPTS
jgi:hypothetical protein